MAGNDDQGGGERGSEVREEAAEVGPSSFHPREGGGGPRSGQRSDTI